MASGEKNTRLTPGGGVNVAGSRIKIVGEDASVGLSLTNQGTSVVIAIPKTSILVNKPSNMTFIVPVCLPAGDYKLSVCTQFASHTLLKRGSHVYLRLCAEYAGINIPDTPAA